MTQKFYRVEGQVFLCWSGLEPRIVVRQEIYQRYHHRESFYAGNAGAFGGLGAAEPSMQDKLSMAAIRI